MEDLKSGNVEYASIRELYSRFKNRVWRRRQ